MQNTRRSLEEKTLFQWQGEGRGEGKEGGGGGVTDEAEGDGAEGWTLEEQQCESAFSSTSYPMG